MTEESISYREYRNEIESIADNVENHVSEYDQEPTEAFFEEVDNHQWIIYTTYHTDILDQSDGPDGWKHLVAEDDSWRDVIQAMAYSAMRADVWRELSNRETDF